MKTLFLILYGEVKPEDTSNAMIEKDKYKLSVHSQVALGEYGLAKSLSFMDVHDEVKFYLQTQYDQDMTLFVKLEAVKLTLYEDDLVSVVDKLDDMMRISKMLEI